MGLFGRKKKKEEELLAQIEKEAAKPEKTLPPAPPKAPPAPKPLAAPAKPPEVKLEKPALATEDVAKLPLFMKVKEYDKIVKELGELTESMKNMDNTLNELSTLEEAEETATKKWRDQLTKTKGQLNALVSQMPETGRLKEVLKVQEKQEGQQELKKELDRLRADVVKASIKPDPSVKLSGEMGSLRGNIKGIQDEVKRLHSEFSSLNTETKKSAEAVLNIKKKVEEKVKKKEEEKLLYEKSKMKEPWK